MRGEPIRPQQKPARGTARLATKAKRRTGVSAEDKLKTLAKQRDSYRCRWPHETEAERRACAQLRIESAHLGHKGMGGDPTGLRTSLPLLITFGMRCHDRFDKVKDRRVVFLTPKKASGPCAFEVKRRGRWIELRRESSLGLLEELRSSEPAPPSIAR